VPLNGKQYLLYDINILLILSFLKVYKIVLIFHKHKIFIQLNQINLII